MEFLEEKLQNGAKALDVGSGSGYLTACMGIMVGSGGSVVGIDHISELQALAKRNILHDNPELLASGRVELVGKLYLKIIQQLEIIDERLIIQIWRL